MRYLTKQLINSCNFYSVVSNTSYRKYVNGFCHGFFGEKIKTNDEKFAIIAQMNAEHINRYDISKIYNEKLIKKIIYDKQGKLKPFNKVIFNKLKKLKVEFEKIYQKQFDIVLGSAKLIRNGLYPFNLKQLAILNKHDADISFNIIEHENLQILYKNFGGYDYNEKYIFYLSNKNNIFIPETSSYDYMKVCNEELFICENNIFEYNILINIIKEPDLYDFYEVSILFSSIEIEKTELDKI